MDLAKFNKIVDEGEQLGFLVEQDKTHPTNPEGIMVGHNDSGFFHLYDMESFHWSRVINDFAESCYGAGLKDGKSK